MDFVSRLGESCAPGVAVPDSVRDTGTDVAVVQGAEVGNLAAEAVARLRASAPAGADERSIGVIVPPGGTWASDMVCALGPESLGNLAVLTPLEAKGLEFDHVVVVEPAEIVADEAVGLRHLYVALTRCTQSLTVVHALPLPPQIGGPERLPAPTAASALSPRDAEGYAADPVESLCNRYFADGTPCTHSTHHADKWCRTAPAGASVPLNRWSWPSPGALPHSSVRGTRVVSTSARVSVPPCGSARGRAGPSSHGTGAACAKRRWNCTPC